MFAAPITKSAAAALIGATLVSVSSVGVAVGPAAAGDRAAHSRPPSPSRLPQTVKFKSQRDFFEIADHKADDTEPNSSANMSLVTMTCLAGCTTPIPAASKTVVAMAVMSLQSYSTQTSTSFARAAEIEAPSHRAPVAAMQVASFDAVQCIAGCATVPAERTRRIEIVAPKRMAPSVMIAKFDRPRSRNSRYLSMAMVTGLRR
jgi:hypothetical protein